MSLPWVSRAAYQSQCDRAAWAENSADTAWALVKTAQAMYTDVLEKYHALKLAGASVPDPKAERLPKPERDPVTQAILAKAGKSQQLRKHYYEFVNEQRKEGFSDETIAAAILKGQDDMEGVP